MKKIILLTILLATLAISNNSIPKETPFNNSLPATIQKINPEFIYKFLLAEISAQRGDFNAAGHLYFDLAKQTKSIPLAERATRIAGSAKNGRLAIDSAEVWSKLDPKSMDAQQILAELFISSGNLSKASPLIKKLLEQDTQRGQGFLYLNSILSKVENKSNALRFIKKIAEPYPNSKEAHFSIAHTAYFAKDKALTNKELDIIENLDPKWETAILFRGYIIGIEWPEKAIAFYQEYLKRFPNSNEVRLEYAKALTGLNKYNLAKKQFLKLVNSSIASSEISLTVALLSIELNDNSLAEKYLLQSLDRGYSQPGQIYLYLAKIYDLKMCGSFHMQKSEFHARVLAIPFSLAFSQGMVAQLL